MKSKSIFSKIKHRSCFQHVSRDEIVKSDVDWISFQCFSSQMSFMVSCSNFPSSMLSLKQPSLRATCVRRLTRFARVFTDIGARFIEVRRSWSVRTVSTRRFEIIASRIICKLIRSETCRCWKISQRIVK